MSKSTESAYFEARNELNGAVEAFIKAARAIDKDNPAIARDIVDSVFDANPEIPLTVEVT